MIIAIDTDGCLIMVDEDGNTYNCGETLEEYGIDNLTPEERQALGV